MGQDCLLEDFSSREINGERFCLFSQLTGSNDDYQLEAKDIRHFAEIRFLLYNKKLSRALHKFLMSSRLKKKKKKLLKMI